MDDVGRSEGKQMPEQENVSEMWMLIIATDDTGHEDTWPLQQMVMATEAEIAELKTALAHKANVGVRAYQDEVTPLRKWREQNAWLFDDESGDA
jgi:hypothetical protein